MATCEQPGTKYDLEKLHQSSEESLRDFIRRFSKRRNSIPNITDAEAIAAFIKGLRHEQLRGKLYRKRPTTIDELIQIANGYTDAEEAKWATRPDRYSCHDDDHCEERCYDDRDRHHDNHDRPHDDREHRQDNHEHQHDNCPDSLRGRQGCYC